MGTANCFKHKVMVPCNKNWLCKYVLYMLHNPVHALYIYTKSLAKTFFAVIDTSRSIV